MQLLEVNQELLTIKAEDKQQKFKSKDYNYMNIMYIHAKINHFAIYKVLDKPKKYGSRYA